MAALNTGTSIVDYLKSTGADSSFTNRAQLAVQNGIVKSAADYLGTADQNTALLSKVSASGASAPKSPTVTPTLPSAPPASPTPTSSTATTSSDAHAIINSGQQADQSAAQTAAGNGEPPTRSSAQSLIDTYAQVAKSLAPATAAPAAPDLTQTLATLRTQYGVDSLESTLNGLNASAAQIQATLTAQQVDENGKPVALNVISGRQTQEQQDAALKLAPIQAQIKLVSDQLTTKYNTINSIMQYTQQDYANAKGAYDTQYSQNIQMFNVVKGIADTQMTQDEAAKDDARANAQIIVNTITSSGSTIASAPAAVQAQLSKLETQAGLPAGFFASLQTNASASKATILSTTTRDSNGSKYADVIYKNADGSLTTQTTYLGAVDKSSGNGTQADQTNAAYATINSLLTKKDSDGVPYLYTDNKFTVEGFKRLVNAAATAGITRAQFISQYSGYISTDPATVKNYGLTAKEMQDLGI